MKKTIKNIALCAFLGLAAGVGFTSCEDYLTITPTNRIVEEDFWEDKNDLQNVVNACYARLIRNDIMKKYIEWGEMRGDNFERTTGNSSTDILNVMNANLLSTNDMFDWTQFYNAINYCNKVLAHGEETIARDESFSRGDWLPIRAEMITLRAFCHYYLLRTFGEVPYVTFDYNNDSQDFLIAQSTQIQVLDSIIKDLESIKADAMNDYGNTVQNAGRVTKKTVYTMLADVYLYHCSAGLREMYRVLQLGDGHHGGKLQEAAERKWSSAGRSDRPHSGGLAHSKHRKHHFHQSVLLQHHGSL